MESEAPHPIASLPVARPRLSIRWSRIAPLVSRRMLLEWSRRCILPGQPKESMRVSLADGCSSSSLLRAATYWWPTLHYRRSLGEFLRSAQLAGSESGPDLTFTAHSPSTNRSRRGRRSRYRRATVRFWCPLQTRRSFHYRHRGPWHAKPVGRVLTRGPDESRCW